MEDGNFAFRVSRLKVFSKLNLHKGYYQVSVAPEDIQKTDIITPFEMYKFLRIPFGLCSAINTFQRKIRGIGDTQNMGYRVIHKTRAIGGYTKNG